MADLPHGAQRKRPRADSPFIAVDWGTSSLRVTVVDDDGPKEEAHRPLGIARVEAGGFADVLADLVDRCGVENPQVLMSGMVGSDVGWVGVEYCLVPAGVVDLASGVRWLTSDERSERLRSWSIGVVPGLRTRDDMGELDVMRGEEVQIFGAGVTDGLVILPGSHSKWAVVERGRIAAFRTYLTGELFAAIARHTLLSRSIEGAADAIDPTGVAFSDAVHAGRGQSMLHDVFTVRTRALEGASPPASAARLSGLLVGAEIADGLRWAGAHRDVVIVGAADLVDVYIAALRACGVQATPGPRSASALGLWRIHSELTR
jgi:2-dehydro-3-deoxygalactonokinase